MIRKQDYTAEKLDLLNPDTMNPCNMRKLPVIP